MAGTRIGVVLNGPDEGKFVLTEFIGSGAFGEVYRAENEEKELVLAAKLLPLGGISDPELKQALLNETNLATKVSHPNVVKVLYVGDNSEIGPYLLMEYVSGQTLEEFIRLRSEKKSLLTLEGGIEIMLQIAQGSRAINDKLVHRDIKPDNILISGRGVKITDFGLSKIVSERTRTLTFKGVGPIRYMAPESWQLQANTPKMDIYSVGFIYYELLTLNHPFQNRIKDPSHIESWRNAHLFEPIDDIRSMRDDIPHPIAQILSRMVAKRAADRPGWDEIISILSSAGIKFEDSKELMPIIEKAIKYKENVEKEKLKNEQQNFARQELDRLYKVSFDQLIARWDKIIDLFNSNFQGGAIKKAQQYGNSITYSLPNAPRIIISLFSRQQTDITISGGNLVGGGFIGIEGDGSANIILIKESEEDIYGKWIACLVKLSPLVDPREALSNLRMKPSKSPFGFQAESDFIEHIRWADGKAIHIFTYEIKMDLDELFRDLLDVAYSK